MKEKQWSVISVFKCYRGQIILESDRFIPEVSNVRYSSVTSVGLEISVPPKTEVDSRSGVLLESTFDNR